MQPSDGLLAIQTVSLIEMINGAKDAKDLSFSPMTEPRKSKRFTLACLGSFGKEKEGNLKSFAKFLMDGGAFLLFCSSANWERMEGTYLLIILYIKNKFPFSFPRFSKNVLE